MYDQPILVGFPISAEEAFIKCRPLCDGFCAIGQHCCDKCAADPSEWTMSDVHDARNTRKDADFHAGLMLGISAGIPIGIVLVIAAYVAVKSIVWAVL